MSSDAGYRLANSQVAIEILPFGATLHCFEVRQPDGSWRSIVLGRQNRTAGDASYLGATVGRFANRIAGARFTLDGTTYQLAANEGPNQLHGGPGGFSEVTWQVDSLTPDSIALSLVSPDGDQGYPGTLRATATFSLLDDGAQVVYSATTDAPTPVNLTTHPYFNLDGSPTTDDHVLTMPASRYTPNQDDGIPTGEIRDVTGSAADFRAGRPLGAARLAADAEGITRNGGFDHNFVVDGAGLREHVRLVGPSGLTLVVRSDAPAVQIYGGDHLGRSGVAIEPQRYPDAPNHDGFGPSVLRPGETYRTTTQWLVTQA